MMSRLASLLPPPPGGAHNSNSANDYFLPAPPSAGAAAQRTPIATAAIGAEGRDAIALQLSTALHLGTDAFTGDDADSDDNVPAEMEESMPPLLAIPLEWKHPSLAANNGSGGDVAVASTAAAAGAQRGGKAAAGPTSGAASQAPPPSSQQQSTAWAPRRIVDLPGYRRVAAILRAQETELAERRQRIADLAKQVKALQRQLAEANDELEHERSLAAKVERAAKDNELQLMHHRCAETAGMEPPPPDVVPPWTLPETAGTARGSISNGSTNNSNSNNNNNISSGSLEEEPAYFIADDTKGVGNLRGMALLNHLGESGASEIVYRIDVALHHPNFVSAVGTLAGSRVGMWSLDEFPHTVHTVANVDAHKTLRAFLHEYAPILTCEIKEKGPERGDKNEHLSPLVADADADGALPNFMAVVKVRPTVHTPCVLEGDGVCLDAACRYQHVNACAHLKTVMYNFILRLGYPRITSAIHCTLASMLHRVLDVLRCQHQLTLVQLMTLYMAMVTTAMEHNLHNILLRPTGGNTFVDAHQQQPHQRDKIAAAMPFKPLAPFRWSLAAAKRQALRCNWPAFVNDLIGDCVAPPSQLQAHLANSSAAAAVNEPLFAQLPEPAFEDLIKELKSAHADGAPLTARVARVIATVGPSPRLWRLLVFCARVEALPATSESEASETSAVRWSRAQRLIERGLQLFPHSPQLWLEYVDLVGMRRNSGNPFTPEARVTVAIAAVDSLSTLGALLAVAGSASASEDTSIIAEAAVVDPPAAFASTPLTRARAVTAALGYVVAFTAITLLRDGLVADVIRFLMEVTGTPGKYRITPITFVNASVLRIALETGAQLFAPGQLPAFLASVCCQTFSWRPLLLTSPLHFDYSNVPWSSSAARSRGELGAGSGEMAVPVIQAAAAATAAQLADALSVLDAQLQFGSVSDDVAVARAALCANAQVLEAAFVAEILMCSGGASGVDIQLERLRRGFRPLLSAMSGRGRDEDAADSSDSEPLLRDSDGDTIAAARLWSARLRSLLHTVGPDRASIYMLRLLDGAMNEWQSAAQRQSGVDDRDDELDPDQVENERHAGKSPRDGGNAARDGDETSASPAARGTRKTQRSAGVASSLRPPLLFISTVLSLRVSTGLPIGFVVTNLFSKHAVLADALAAAVPRDVLELPDGHVLAGLTEAQWLAYVGFVLPALRGTSVTLRAMNAVPHRVVWRYPEIGFAFVMQRLKLSAQRLAVGLPSDALKAAQGICEDALHGMHDVLEASGASWAAHFDLALSHNGAAIAAAAAPDSEDAQQRALLTASEAQYYAVQLMRKAPLVSCAQVDVVELLRLFIANKAAEIWGVPLPVLVN